MARTSGVLDRVRKVTAATAKTLQAELHSIEQEKTRLTADLDQAAAHIRHTLQQLGHGSNGSAPKRRVGRPAGKTSKRIRRTLDQLKAEAQAIIELVQSKGKEGATGPEIRKRHAKIGPDLKGFVQKYSGKKLKTTGVARSMRYFAP